MKLFKVTFEVRYQETPPDIFNYRNRIISSVSAGDVKVPDNLNEGFSFVIKRKNSRVTIENKRFGLDMFFTDFSGNQVKYSKENINKVVKLINSELKIKKIERIGIRSWWFEEVLISKNELVDKFKQNFLCHNDLISSAVDISIPLTLSKGQNRINYNSGPMDKDEMTEVIKNNINSIPGLNSFAINQTSVILDFDFYLSKKTQYSDNFVSSYVEEGLLEAEKAAQLTMGLLA